MMRCQAAAPAVLLLALAVSGCVRAPAPATTPRLVRPRQRLGRPDPQEDDRRGEGRPDDRLPLHGRVPQRRQRVYPRARIARLEVRDRRPDPLRAGARLRDGRARQRLPEAGQGAAPHGLRFRAGSGQPGHGRDPLPAAHGARGDRLRGRLAYAMGRITALEGRAMGIHMAYAPVVDVNINPDNPIINTRSIGADPALVSRLADGLHPRRPGQRHDRHGQALPRPRRHVPGFPQPPADDRRRPRPAREGRALPVQAGHRRRRPGRHDRPPGRAGPRPDARAAGDPVGRRS